MISQVFSNPQAARNAAFNHLYKEKGMPIHFLLRNNDYSPNFYKFVKIVRTEKGFCYKMEIPNREIRGRGASLNVWKCYNSL